MNKFISDKYINKPKKPTNIIEVSFKENRFDGDEIIEENNKKIIKSILKKILDTAKSYLTSLVSNNLHLLTLPH